ncbi:hypothetical protein BDY21DRAFT_351226 [Lineolata rhizophorae]|uniref:Uncharacterized protein n=1 Tax=Lineolata rhizophorae TaxID=578093 RepID=A0A6A6NV17_9PEZI|nr:hypothetical protein BDY21DRAFT_351226 [Lineolata rhizophorae]
MISPKMLMLVREFPFKIWAGGRRNLTVNHPASNSDESSERAGPIAANTGPDPSEGLIAEAHNEANYGGGIRVDEDVQHIERGPYISPYPPVSPQGSNDMQRQEEELRQDMQEMQNFDRPTFNSAFGAIRSVRVNFPEEENFEYRTWTAHIDIRLIRDFGPNDWRIFWMLLSIIIGGRREQQSRPVGIDRRYSDQELLFFHSFGTHLMLSRRTSHPVIRLGALVVGLDNPDYLSSFLDFRVIRPRLDIRGIVYVGCGCHCREYTWDLYHG